MKKIIIRENQLKTILKEESRLPNFNNTVKFSFDYYDAKFKGHEIDDIPDEEITVFFNIDIEYRTHGIKTISIDNITLPDEISVIVYYFNKELDDVEDEYVKLIINPNIITSEISEEISFIGLDRDGTIVLYNDDEGNLKIKEIKIVTHQF